MEYDVPALLTSIAGMVHECGWAAVSVFPTDDAPGNPFTYTVGHAPTANCEFIVVGLPPDAAHEVLRRVHELVDAGWRPSLDEGPREDLIPSGLRAAITMTTEDEQAQLATAHQFYGEAAFVTPVPGWVAWKVLLPDVDNRLPGEPDYSPSMLALQVL